MNTTSRWRRLTPSLVGMLEHMLGNALIHGPGHARPETPRRGRTGAHRRVESGAALCLLLPLAKQTRAGGPVQRTQIMANLDERTGSWAKRANQRPGDQKGQQRSDTQNPERITLHVATMEEARRTRMLPTAGGVAGRRTSSKFLVQALF